MNYSQFVRNCLKWINYEQLFRYERNSNERNEIYIQYINGA